MCFLDWLGANKDGIHTLTELLGLLALVAGTFKFIGQHARTRREEVMKRNLDMQREVYLELIGLVADTFTEVGRLAVPGHNYVPVTGLAGALMKIQILASQKTVEKILQVSTLINEGILRILTLRNEATKRDAAVGAAYQQIQAQYQQLVAVETSLRNGSTSAVPIDHARMALQVAGQAHEAARIAGIAAWTAFYDAMRDFLDRIAEHSLAAILAVREELSVETEGDAFSAAIRAHRDSARRLVLEVFEQIRRQHLALPAESYTPQPAAVHTPAIPPLPAPAASPSLSPSDCRSDQPSQ